MKKKNRTVSFVLIVVTAIVCFTCKGYIGLGGQIDILPPIGEIIHPDGGGGIRGSFLLKGKASDDGGVQSVSVVFKNVKTEQRSRVYDAGGFSKGSASVEWTAHIDNEANENGYAIPDGEYEAIVTVTDKGGKSSTFTKNYKIDNTPPQVEVLRPDVSKNQSGDFTMRGSIIDILSGVKSVKYIVGKQEGEDITKEPSETALEWKALDISVDTWAIDFTDADNITQKAKAETLGKKVEGLAAGVELYDIPLFFLAEDKAGNIGIISKIIRVDPNGDIPEVTVLSPVAGQVLGGTIRIWGTVSVPNPAAGQVGSVWIQITNKTKIGHSDEPDFSESVEFGSVDWCPSDGKQVTYTVGSPYWAVEINKSKEFEALSGTKQDIWFRLRGKNDRTEPVAGQWTAPIKITVDKAAPTITGMKVATGGNINTPIPSWPIDPENQDYVSNMWIKGDALYLCADLAHDAGIERIDISGSYVDSSFTLSGDSEITGSNINNTGKAWFTQSTVPSSTSAKNYKMRIPLKTTANPGSNNEFTINVTIRAQKQGEIEGLTASSSFSFKYDNTAPTAVFGTKIHSSGTIPVSGTSFTDYALRGKTNISTSMKVFASGEDIAITAFDKTSGTVTLASAPANPTKGYLIYSPIEYLRPDASGQVWVSGAAYDVGAGVEKVKVKYDDLSATEVVLEFPSGVQTDVGNGDANFVTWKGVIDVSAPTIVDGKGKIVITPIDRANNAAAPIEVPVKLKKEPLKIDSVVLGTDMNRNGAIADVGSTVVETKTVALTYNAANPDGIDSEKYDWHGKADGGTFRFKNNTSHIKIGTGGGSGDKKYTLKRKKISDSLPEVEVHNLRSLPSSGIIELAQTDFDKIKQSDNLESSNPTKRTLVLTVWDSAQGLTCGTDTWMAELELDVIVDTKDRVAPTNTIDPFKWVSESENSLYGNSRDNGHIEIGTDLPGTFNQTTGLMDKDDKVSGKISITGTAYDDQVITEIWAKIDDFTFTGVAGAVLGGETKLAAYSAASGTFTVESGNVDTNGWKFTVVSNEFSVEKGHTVKWQLDWDSSKITNGVGLDKTVTVTVKDTAQTNTASDSRKVDVVPYITEIVTANRTKSGLSKNTIRASNGKYSIIKGTIADFIEVKGFNLQKGTETPVVKLVKADSISTVTSNNSEGTAITPSSSSNTSFKISNDVNLSGYLEVFVNGVRAINNINVNAKPYNKEEDIYILKNKTLTDDRYLRLFDMKQTQISNGYYPEMIMDGNDPVFGLINPAGYQTSYGKNIEFAWPLQALYQTQRIKFDSASGNIAMTGGLAQIEYIAGAINWDQFAMAKDTSNKYHYISVYNYNKAGMMYAYHSYAELEKSYMNKVGGWGAGSGYSGYNGKFASEVGNNALVLDSLAYKTSSSILERYRYPKILAKGDSNTAAGASVYIAYYDAVNNDTTKQGIKFRSFKIGDNLTGGTRSMANTIKSNFDGYSVKIETVGNPVWRVWRGYNNPNDSNGRQEVGEGGSRFFDMGVTSDNHVVIVYFDEAEAKLKVKYSEVAIDGSNPTGTITWKDAAVTFPEYAGTYVSMDIDSNNGIHIAAFDSSDGDLKYFYLPSYNSSSLTSMTVDAAFSVGQWTQIKVQNGKPYIAYYNNTEAGQRSAIKLAVAEGTVTTTGDGGIGTIAAGVDEQGFVTGKWDCMTVPSVTPAQGGTPKFKKVNLGFDSAGIPVLGYLGETIEFGKWLDE